MKIIKPSVTFRWATPAADAEIASAARLCYQSDEKNKTDEEMIEMILERGHFSVIEHASMSYQAINDRGVSHEEVRHRLFAFSQESTRYCNYSKDKFDKSISVIQPPLKSQGNKDTWATAMMNAENRYMELITAGEAAQIARSVLPTCTKTEIRMTTNLREWLHFFDMRTSVKAHPQMREIADAILADALSRNISIIFKPELIKLASQDLEKLKERLAIKESELSAAEAKIVQLRALLVAGGVNP